MQEFLVEITTAVPQDVPAEEVDRRRAAEHERAAELAATGRLFRLWRPVGEKRSVGIWRAEDEARLRTDVLGTLPMWPWMTAVVTPLEPHPNDPGSGSR
ncbi:muconolactone Delta-isomerase family protein [Kitasatospora sp. NPDC051984]|uniref:muconolactone Delta-isomerase family protein n=1 Tax=Kitasatospora sp. NPDC051984 TaxID=3364059 RepID=UPI0037C6CE38